jgi:hypothetical protein
LCTSFSDKKVVGVFVRFRAPASTMAQKYLNNSTYIGWDFGFHNVYMYIWRVGNT